MHQSRFCEAVKRAYQSSCAIYRLKRTESVEVAHTVGDADGRAPVVRNDRALRKLHHAVFDRYVLGVRPDLRMAIRAYTVREIDGPMLFLGLRDSDGLELCLIPRREARSFLERLLELR